MTSRAKTKLIILLICPIWMGCSGLHKIYESKSEDGHIEIKKGYFQGITYLQISKGKGKREEFRIQLDCECSDWNGGVAKNSSDWYWRAVTDTLPKPIFYDAPINEVTLTKPMVFRPISKEEVALLEMAIALSKEECCQNKKRPIRGIIGFVKTDLRK